VTVEFGVLGEIEARLNGEPVDLGHARQRSVLAVLLVEANHPVPVDQMVGRVWGERAPNSARESLYSYLSRLRQALPDAAIVRRSGGYVLNADPATIDLHRFLRLIGQARDSSDVALFEEALGLWRGEPFAGLSSPWLSTMRESLEQKRLAAELDRNDLELSQGIGRVPELSLRAAQFPLDERLAGQLMLALQRTGQQSRALAVYDETRRALADQLGIDPSPELTQLRQQILTNSANPAARFDLPRDVNQFTGRTTELRYLLRSLEESSIAAIDGMAGIGKTALAVRLAHQLAPQYPHGQLFLDLHAYTPGSAPLAPTAALDKLLRAVGVSGAAMPEDLDERAALWRTKLVGQRMLIVLDNAADTAQVRPLLPGTSECLVLVTSRQRLTGLDGTRVLSLEVLAPAEADELFGRVIGAARKDAEPEAVEDVLQLCGYLPLAIRLAAARLQHRPTWTVAHLAKRLRDQRQLAELKAEDRSVATAFSLSYLHLDAAHQRMFRLLGRVPGADFDVHTAAALGDVTLPEADRLLEGLFDVHLLQQPSAGRYRLHDLLHAYASQLEEPCQEEALDRLLGYYQYATSVAMDVIAPHERHRRAEISSTNIPAPVLSSYNEAMKWLETERFNLLAATHLGNQTYTSRLSATLWRYLYLRGNHDDALTLHTDALHAARATGDRVLEGQAIYHIGMCFERLGKYEDAADHLARAIEIFRETSARLLEGHALNSLGLLYSWRRDHEKAVAYYQEAAAVGHETGTGALEGLALDNLGIIHAELGRPTDAIAHYERALAIYQEIDSPYLEGSALDNLGMIFNQIGRYEEARDHLERALKLARGAANRDLEVQVLNSLGENGLSVGDPVRALEHHQLALTISEETGLRIGQAHAHEGLGRAHNDLADLKAAQHHWRLALATYTELGVPEAENIRRLLGSS
jgi:DNA-binding SARP family transcriptional activator/Flp pilus assembly protein TadD